VVYQREGCAKGSGRIEVREIRRTERRYKWLKEWG
jgi:hypothetical protein